MHIAIDSIVIPLLRQSRLCKKSTGTETTWQLIEAVHSVLLVYLRYPVLPLRQILL